MNVLTRHHVWSRAARRGRVREEARMAIEAHLVRVRVRVRVRVKVRVRVLGF